MIIIKVRKLEVSPYPHVRILLIGKFRFRNSWKKIRLHRFLEARDDAKVGADVI